MRTPASYWLVVFALGCLGAVGFALLVTGAGMPGAGSHPWLLATCALLGVAPIAYFAGTPEYRVGGGRGAIRFFPDRIEVPAAVGPRPLVFPRQGLLVTQREVLVRLGLTGVALRRGTVLEIQRATMKRRISTLTLVDQNTEEALLADLQLFVQGQAPLGAVLEACEALMAKALSPKRDVYDEQLDREIAEYDP